uniref:Uncharacterized protein n=1 Tax=viral metagenome TaxID=1070528 RepID=A0A6C0H7N8_9ZZZZ
MVPLNVIIIYYFLKKIYIPQFIHRIKSFRKLDYNNIIEYIII